MISSKLPEIPDNFIKQLLEICTKEIPFMTPDGRLFKQIAMGSPLGPTFANFYIEYLEEIVFSNQNIWPLIYGVHVDNIFIMYSAKKQLEKDKKTFENNSILKFTIEHIMDNKLTFLDILTTKN